MAAVRPLSAWAKTKERSGTRSGVEEGGLPPPSARGALVHELAGVDVDGWLHDREGILWILRCFAVDLRTIGLMIFFPNGELAVGRVDGESKERFRHLVRLDAAGFLDRLGQSLHADITLDGPGGGVLVLQVLADPGHVLPVGGRTLGPVEGVVGIAPDADGIIRAHGLRGLGGAGLAGAEEVVLDGLEVAEGLG